MVRPVCVAGERHCPPEDVGGVPGYQEFLEVVFDPSHEEFDLRTVNAALSRMRWPARHRR
jgi:hypothetical protein